jgi:electron transfer flavoprotein beta subunit
MPLKIVVGIKWVPNTTSVSIDEKTGTLIREGVPSVVNPHDLIAVEAALKLKDRYGGHVTAISMAPPQAILGLEHVIGMGVDEGILISDRAFAGADTLATSYTLAKAIEKIGDYDLVIMGHETIDSSTAHIGAQVASWLDIPYIYYAVNLEYIEDKHLLRVRRILEDSIEIYNLRLPGLVSIAMHSDVPRRVSLTNKLRARIEKPIRVWSNKELDLDPNCIGLRGSPTVVAKVEFMPKVPRKQEVYKDGDPKEAAKWLVERLVKEGLLKIPGGE